MTTTGHIPVSSLKFVNQEKSLTQLMLSNFCLLGVRKPIELTKVDKNQSAQLSDCLRWQQLTEVKNSLIWMQPGNRRNFKFYTDIICMVDICIVDGRNPFYQLIGKL